MPFLQKQLKNLKGILKKCLDKRNCMTRSGAAAVNLRKCQYFDKMAFLHGKSANKVTETNLSQPSTFSTEVFTEENQCSPLSSPCSSNSSNFDISKTSTKSKKRCTDSMQLDALAQSLQDCDKMIQRSLIDENDEDYLFCRSLVPMLKKFPQREKKAGQN